MTDLAHAVLITDPPMEATHFGIPVSYFGEDGELIALGHHGLRRLIAAFNRHARVYLGLDNIADDRSAQLADYLPLISQQWATFHKPDPDNGVWDQVQDWMWVAEWADASTPGALPVSILKA
ncbi:hypothetical protein ACFVYT_24760 [Streptomyces sp. NPDC058290]|uniref:hypothetical protein n=1 Tax=Streptomyces sp. NPDC058290 TaxID=3346426 RepID=UPI0036E4F4F6